MTDDPSSRQAADEPEGDKPAALVPDDAPTEVSSAGPPEAAATEAPAPPEPPAAFAPAAPAAPEPPAAFAPAGTSQPPAAPPPPPPVSELPPVGDTSSGPGGLAAAFPPDRPERAIGAAFGGGLVLALILKRLAR